MAKISANYEVVYILDPAQGEEAIAANVAKFQALAEQHGCSDVVVDEWGKRRLAYAIDYKTEGYYVLMSFTSAPEFPKELDRKLAHKNHYPAIDVLQSISRCMSQIATREHKSYAGRLKNVMATYAEAEDLINIGAYKNGSNPDIDYAIRKNKEVNEFLCQDTEEKFAFDEEVELLKKVFDD